jgi:hypothetical protein
MTNEPPPLRVRLDAETSEALRVFARTRSLRPSRVAQGWIAERLRGERGDLRCTFCGKHEGQVRKFIAGPHGVLICDECIDLCAEIIAEEETQA